MRARKIVLATGQEGIGGWWMPEPIAALPARFRAHTNEMIDFQALRGKVVAVLGAGASAFDNAAVALEHGAADPGQPLPGSDYPDASHGTIGGLFAANNTAVAVARLSHCFRDRTSFAGPLISAAYPAALGPELLEARSSP